MVDASAAERATRVGIASGRVSGWRLGARLTAVLGLLLAATLGVLAATGLGGRVPSRSAIAPWDDERAPAGGHERAAADPGEAHLDSGPGRAPEGLNPTEASPRSPAVEAGRAPSFRSRDGTITFTVPEPGDAAYADYQEMLQHPRYRSAFQNSPGYALPYDPEWRSEVSGRRTVERRNMRFDVDETSMEELARAFLTALVQDDEESLLRLCLSRDEFERILWPEFPQSRPYLRVPPDDAWMLQRSTTLHGLHTALRNYGGRDLELMQVHPGTRMDYTNFTLFRDVVLRVRDRQSREVFDLRYIPTMVGCGGRYKAYIYEVP